MARLKSLFERLLKEFSLIAKRVWFGPNARTRIHSSLQIRIVVEFRFGSCFIAFLYYILEDWCKLCELLVEIN
jgi:hypothetical protein